MSTNLPNTPQEAKLTIARTDDGITIRAYGSAGCVCGHKIAASDFRMGLAIDGNWATDCPDCHRRLFEASCE
jgi:hypothetical protein